MTDEAGTTGYGYDALQRLASVDPPGGGSADTVHYEYDAAGNRLHAGLESGGTWLPPYVDYAYGDGGVPGRVTHRLAEATDGASGATLEGFPAYDANGNPTSWEHEGEPRTLTWDALDRLIAIGGVEFDAGYVYDPLGRRIEKTEQGKTTRYQYDGLDVVAEYDGAYALQASYLFGPGIDEPLKVEGVSAGIVAAYHGDGIGSIVSITEIGGSAGELASYAYDAFGVLEEGGGPFANAYTYTGRERDASGLYYYRARYYLASVGRFLTPDPIGLAGGVNPYTYVGSNPVNFRDPFGLVAAAGSSSYANAGSPHGLSGSYDPGISMPTARQTAWDPEGQVEALSGLGSQSGYPQLAGSDPVAEAQALRQAHERSGLGSFFADQFGISPQEAAAIDERIGEFGSEVEPLLRGFAELPGGTKLTPFFVTGTGVVLGAAGFMITAESMIMPAPAGLFLMGSGLTIMGVGAGITDFGFGLLNSTFGTSFPTHFEDLPPIP